MASTAEFGSEGFRHGPSAIDDNDLRVALELAARAGDAIMAVYAGDFSVEHKVEDEPVTRADCEANALIVAGLLRHFPGDATLTEEAGFAAPGGWNGSRLWVVDPLDGTKEFIKRNGEFAVQIALIVDNRPRLGVVHAPALSQTWAAVRNAGCWRWREGQWQRVTVPARGGSGGAVAVSRSHPSALSTKVAERLGLRDTLPHGSVGLKLGAIAGGRVHLYLNDSNSTKAWDIAAPEIILTEAGGSVTDLRGDLFSYDPAAPRHRHGLLASADLILHRQALAVIADLG